MESFFSLYVESAAVRKYWCAHMHARVQGGGPFVSQDCRLRTTHTSPARTASRTPCRSIAVRLLTLATSEGTVFVGILEARRSVLKP